MQLQHANKQDITHGRTVGSFSGYTVFEHVDLSGVSGATDSELSEIENTLKGGVWL